MVEASKPKLLTYVMVDTETGKEKEVMGSLRGLPEVKAYEVYGIYDIIAEVSGTSLTDARYATEKIRRLPSVTKTLTMNVIGGFSRKEE